MGYVFAQRTPPNQYVDIEDQTQTPQSRGELDHNYRPMCLDNRSRKKAVELSLKWTFKVVDSFS